MEESGAKLKNGRKVAVVFLCALTFILGALLTQPLSTTSNQYHPRPLSQASPALNTNIAIDPYSVIDLQHTITDIVFTVNITNAPPINGFAVVLAYDSNILHAVSLDKSGNILTQIPGGSEFPTRWCLDGTQGPGGPSECTLGDGPGVTALIDTNLGQGLTPNNSTGTLFTLHLQPVAQGFSQVRIKQAYLTDGTGNALPISTFDGFYTSVDCPKNSGIPCAPSSPDFTWVPRNPVVGKDVVFYGNLSKPSPGVSIIDYKWNFGDGTTNSFADTKTNSTSEHIYASVGSFPVTLYINDSNYITTLRTHQVTAHSELVEIGISDIKIVPGTVNLIPGTIVTITATIHNYGAKNVSDTARLILDGTRINQTSIPKLTPGADTTITAVWDTTKYAPNAYRVDAYVPPVANQTSTAHSSKSVWVQLIIPNPGGLGMWPTAGIGVSVLGVVGYGVSRVRRRGLPLEPL